MLPASQLSRGKQEATGNPRRLQGRSAEHTDVFDQYQAILLRVHLLLEATMTGKEMEQQRRRTSIGGETSEPPRANLISWQ